LPKGPEIFSKKKDQKGGPEKSQHSTEGRTRKEPRTRSKGRTRVKTESEEVTSRPITPRPAAGGGLGVLRKGVN